MPQDRLRGTSREIVETARQLRQRQTPAEIILWDALRDKRAFPERVRRQHAYGQYILDFWIPAARIAIELDGPIHDDAFISAQDEDRTSWLASQDIQVLRFQNDLVMNHLATVITAIKNAIATRTLAADGSPLPPRERGWG